MTASALVAALAAFAAALAFVAPHFAAPSRASSSDAPPPPQQQQQPAASADSLGGDINRTCSSTSAATTMRLPVAFVTHGAGPLPLLGEPSQAALAAAMRALPSRLGLEAGARSSTQRQQGQALRAVLLVSAHFEERRPTVVGAPPPGGRLLYDYGGFPPEAYRLEYSPPGSLEVAEDAMRALRCEDGGGGGGR